MVESARPSSRSLQSLEGDWRDELLFVLQQSLELYDTYTGKIAECDQRIEAHLRTMQSKPGASPQPLPETAQPHKLGARFNLRDHLHRIAGVDLTKINGLDVQTVQIIISEVGVDMSRWNTEKSFASWLGPVSGQSAQRWQNPKTGDPAGRKPRGHCLTFGGVEPYPKPKCARGQLPPITIQARRPQSDHSDGPQAGETDVQNDEVRLRIHRQGNDSLRI